MKSAKSSVYQVSLCESVAFLETSSGSPGVFMVEMWGITFPSNKMNAQPICCILILNTVTCTLIIY